MSTQPLTSIDFLRDGTVVKTLFDAKGDAVHHFNQPTACSPLSAAGLDEVVRSSGLADRPATPSRVAETAVTSFRGKTYKVRAYRSATEAQWRLGMMSLVQHLFVQCHGRIGRFVVLEYIPEREIENGPSVQRKIGTFLGELANVELRVCADGVYGYWQQQLEKQRVFLPKTMQLVHRHFLQTSAEKITWTLMHGDLAPRNFVLTRTGRLLAIDEKHLRIAPRGVGLIQPEWRLRETEFAEFQSGYCEKRNTINASDDPALTLFYHCMDSLAYKSNYFEPDRLHLHPDAFHERRALLKTISAPWMIRMIETIRWDIRYVVRRLPSSTRRACAVAVRRIKRGLAHLNGLVLRPSPEQKVLSESPN